MYSIRSACLFCFFYTQDNGIKISFAGMKENKWIQVLYNQYDWIFDKSNFALNLILYRLIGI